MENEIKVLEVDPDAVMRALDELGAVKVFDGPRVITHFDTADRRLEAESRRLKVTREGGLKLTVTGGPPGDATNEVKTPVGENIYPILAQVGLVPIAAVEARRVSYELGTVDFDLDFFPGIPPFLEVDIGGVSDVAHLLSMVGLSHADQVRMTTPDIFARYGMDYFQVFQN